MLGRFGELFSKKLQTVAHFSKKNEKSSIWPKLATFRGNNHVSAFWSTFQQKVAKRSSFRENERKFIHFAKTCNSSRKLPCFGVLVNFSAKSCKKWLISSKTTKNHRFAQNLHLFDETTMFRRFGHFFQEKVKEEGSFREKARKIIDLAKTSNSSRKPPCFGVLVNFSAKSCKEWLISWKRTNIHRFGEKLQLFQQTIWPKLATFRANYHVSAFWWRSESFREKARKIVDLAKTNNFSNKLPCFGVLVSFSAKSCKKYCRSISGTSYNYGVRDLNLLLSPLPQLR